MSVNQFMEANLRVIRDEIIINIPNEEFDSHEFIRNFAKRFERDYVEFLSSYRLEPFRIVHAQIGSFLSEHQRLLNIRDIGSAISSNIFGIESSNEKWIKV